jgi:hypothetical protein
MTFDYSKLAQIALAQIANFGRDVVLKRVMESTYNYTTGTNTGGSTTTETIKAVVTDYELKQIDGTIIQRGDKLYTMAAQGLNAPKTNDFLDDWKILAVDTIQTGDTALLYKCQVRK